MKNFIIIITLLLISCKKSDNSQKVVSSKNNENESKKSNKRDLTDSIKVYSWEEYIDAESKVTSKKIIVIDTVCPYEIKRAKKDILKNKLVYFCRNSSPEVVEELNLLTKKYNITAVYTLNSCIVAPKGFTEYCYENLIMKEIKKRNGKNWIDSLEKVALKNYVIKHPNEPYFENGIDLRRNYLNK